MACEVVDRAIQAFGAEGVSQDQHLASILTMFSPTGTGCSTYINLVETCRLDIPPLPGPYPAGWPKELMRAPELHKRAAEMSKKEAAIMQKAGVKAHL
ncbi:hypothetical protein JVT61DRAFT_12752 [Boletus reticuloceps]|uniref:Uncharacterized protein n=1 Tax=Boletus reticuloceps TaxID=495285 RepID=A0A8I2YVL9_9AGAM|nr:hypothetical protein JVT61DRAFT_12752 [Boletus reticuloceps]